MIHKSLIRQTANRLVTWQYAPVGGWVLEEDAGRVVGWVEGADVVEAAVLVVAVEADVSVQTSMRTQWVRLARRFDRMPVGHVVSATGVLAAG